MEASDTIYTSPSSSSNPPQSVVISPCAACKILRRRCVDKCVLAPYFPPHDPLKFTTAHRVFGASNIIKFLQELPEAQRDDAVSSMVYEANARLRDPVYGCAGAIYQLQKQINELQEQLAKAQAEIVNMQCQHSNLMALSPIQSGCCKPPTSCGYVFMNETYWAPREGLVGTDPDCLRWNYNDQGQLCYDCDSCKAGVLASLKKSWRKVSVINIAILIILVIVYCVAFRHNKRIDNDEPYGETRMEKSQPSRIHF